MFQRFNQLVLVQRESAAFNIEDNHAGDWRMEGNQPSTSEPVQRALAAGSNVASTSPRPKPKGRESDVGKVPGARGTALQPFETQPANRSAVKSTAARAHAPNPKTTPKKQTTLPGVSPSGKSNAPNQPPAPKANPVPMRARCATAVGSGQGQARYIAQAPRQGIQHAVAKNVVNLVSDDDTSSSEESDDDVPLAAQPPPAQPAAAKAMFDLTAGDSSDIGQGGERNDGDMGHEQAAENPPPAQQQGVMVVELVSSDDDACPQQQAADGGVPEENESAVGEHDARHHSTVAPEKQFDRAAGSANELVLSDCQGVAVALDMAQKAQSRGEIQDTEMVDREAANVEQNAPTGGSNGTGTSKGALAPAGAEAAPPVFTAQHQSEDAGAQLQHEPVDEEMHDRDALPDTADVPVEDTSLIPVTEHVEDDAVREHKSAVLADIAQALSGGGTSQAKAPAGQKEHGQVQCTKAHVPTKGVSVKKEKQTKSKTHKHPQTSAKYDKKGPMLFHHISRQPLSIGLAATEDLHRRIDREDQNVWQYWVTSLRRRMRQHTMSQGEAHYIFRFEHYRFCLPHSQNALWPSVVEGFIRRYGNWIQEDPVVREVCHAHLLRLTRLRLLAPMQTQHCLKMLNGTITPCPDYMFDHLRPADPTPPVEDNGQDEDELAEEERRKEAVAVARLAALQKAAAGTKTLVGLNWLAPGVQASQIAPKSEPGGDAEHPGELERLLGSDLPTDHVSLRVKKELMKLDSTLANRAGTLDAGASSSQAPKKIKLKIKRKPSALPVMFRYVSPSEYPEAEQRQIAKGRVRKLSDICHN